MGRTLTTRGGAENSKLASWLAVRFQPRCLLGVFALAAHAATCVHPAHDMTPAKQHMPSRDNEQELSHRIQYQKTSLPASMNNGTRALFVKVVESNIIKACMHVSV